jgi:hypothetical protein
MQLLKKRPAVAPRRASGGRRRPVSVASVRTASGKVIKSDFKLGSVERSIDLDKEGIHYYKSPRFGLAGGDQNHRYHYGKKC